MEVKQADVALTESQKSLSLKHVHLVDLIALSLRVHSVDCDEVRSSGYEAILKAAQEFDPSLGVPFGAYATMRIRWAMHRCLRDLRRLRRREALFGTDSEMPQRWLPAAPLAEQAAMDLEDELLRLERRFILELALHQSIATLVREERQVLCEHYFHERQLKEIANARSSSYATMRRRHHAAVQRLKAIMHRRLTPMGANAA